MPELVERIFLFLDPASSLHLLHTGLVEKQVLRDSLSSKAWNRLIRRCSFGVEGALQRADLKRVVQIVKRMELEDSSAFLRPLLELVCEKFPAPNYEDLWMGEVRGEVQITCPCQADPHKVSFNGFLLLEEEVEGVFGSAEQSVKSVEAKHDLREPFLSALSSRISRQQNPITTVSVGGDLEIGNGTERHSALGAHIPSQLTSVHSTGDLFGEMVAHWICWRSLPVFI